MKPEKMTDESLRALLYDVSQTWSAKAADDLRTHIAALTDERDELGQELAELLTGMLAMVSLFAIDDNEQGLDAARRVVSERDALREQLAKMTAERDTLEREAASNKAGWEDVARERDALRESGREHRRLYLEACAQLTGVVNENSALHERVRALEADLAAIRREDAAVTRRRGMLMGEAPIPTPDSTTAGWRDTYRESHRLHQHWARRAEAAESRLSAIRQRAGDTKALVEAHQSGMGCASVARYIVGDEAECPQAKPCDPETPGVYECPAGCACRCHATAPQADAPSEMDGMRGEMAEPETKAERLLREEREAEAEMVRKAAEPTVPEAFATVRAQLSSLRGAAHVMHELGAESDGSVERGATNAERALSLLERSMGAMEAAARSLIAGAKEGRVIVADVNALEAALTGTPPGFTLEEVAHAISSITVPSHPDVCENVKAGVLDNLRALRRKP